MLRKLRPRSAYDVMAAIALFIAVAGGSAYAADTIGSADVIDNSLTGADIRGKATPGFVDGSLDTYDIRNRSLTGGDLVTNSLTASEIGPNSANTSEIKNGAVTKAKLAPLGAWSPLPFNKCGDSSDDGETFHDVNWSNVGGYAPGAVRLDAYGVVHLRGAVQCVADLAPPSLNLIATLPAGSRPKAKERFPVASSEEFDGSGISRGAAFVDISPDGKVTVFDYHRAFISLSGIEFDALN